MPAPKSRGTHRHEQIHLSDAPGSRCPINPMIARNAAWLLNESCPPRRRPARFTRARCTLKSSRIIRAIARNAGWRSSRKRSRDGAEEDAEIRSLARKFWIALVLTLPVLFIAMGHMIPGVHVEAWIPKGVSKWIEFLLDDARRPVGWRDIFRAGPGVPSSTAASTCSRSSPSASVRPFFTARSR